MRRLFDYRGLGGEALTPEVLCTIDPEIQTLMNALSKLPFVERTRFSCAAYGPHGDDGDLYDVKGNILPPEVNHTDEDIGSGYFILKVKSLPSWRPSADRGLSPKQHMALVHSAMMHVFFTHMASISMISPFTRFGANEYAFHNRHMGPRMTLAMQKGWWKKVWVVFDATHAVWQDAVAGTQLYREWWKAEAAKP